MEGFTADLFAHFGMTGAVLVVCWFFVRYITHRDERDERVANVTAEAIRSVAVALDNLSRERNSRTGGQ